jgi:hypothetical protein
MKWQKRIWELQHTTVCKVIGMAFDLQELKKIGRKFGLIIKDTALEEDFAFHSAIVGMCGKESNLSRYVQKTIERRFLRYAKRLNQQGLSDITGMVMNKSECSGIPLWAILWHLAISQISGGDQLETALFGHIHMLEHRLLKDFWDEEEGHREKIENDYREEISNLRKEIVRLRAVNSDLEKASRRLTSRSGPALANSEALPSSTKAESRAWSNDQSRKLETLKNLLDESRAKNQKLAQDFSQAKKQIEALTRELVSQEIPDSGGSKEPTLNGCQCPLNHSLRGKRIAMVGGIDSLEAHYKNLVERSGGKFCRHDGKCCRGERVLEDCIRNADLVVCPISVNSHFGASGVKRVCRRHGISCSFPDSAGLGSLRNVLAQHFATDEEQLEDSVKVASNE